MPELEKKYDYMNNLEKSNKRTEIASVLGSILTTTIEKNELSTKNNKNQNNYSFFCQTPPQVSLKDYLERIIKYTRLEDSTLIIAVIYLHRITTMSDVIICKNNVHK
jgi:hypothetical protein